MNPASLRTSSSFASLRARVVASGATLALLVAVAGAGAWGCGSKTPPATEAVPAGTGAPAAGALDATAAKALVEKRCVGCHGIDKVDAVKTDAAGWEKIVADMEKRGLKVGAEERKQIIDYLATR